MEETAEEIHDRMYEDDPLYRQIYDATPRDPEARRVWWFGLMRRLLELAPDKEAFLADANKAAEDIFQRHGIEQTKH